MTILFAGGEMGAFIPSDSSAVEAVGSNISWDSAFSRCAITASGSTSYNEAPEWSGQTDIWVHVELKQYAPVSSGSLLQTFVLMDSSGNEKIRLACSINVSTGIGTWALQLNNAGWATIGSTFDASVLSRQTVDIHIVCNSATGVADLYLSGTKRISNPSVDLSTVSDIAQLRPYGKSTVIPAVQSFSQIIVATTSTIGGRLMTVPPTAAGATNQWTGAYTGIDEIAYSDADFMFSDAADQVQMFAGTPVGSLTGYSVAAVVVTARARTDGTGPENIQLAVRTNSTNYFSSSRALDAGYSAHVGIWETNPNTTQAWTAAEAAAIQFGVKSIA